MSLTETYTHVTYRNIYTCHLQKHIYISLTETYIHVTYRNIYTCHLQKHIYMSLTETSTIKLNVIDRSLFYHSSSYNSERTL